MWQKQPGRKPRGGVDNVLSLNAKTQGFLRPEESVQGSTKINAALQRAALKAAHQAALH